KLNFNFIRDIAPVCGIIRVPLIMEVHPSVPVKTVAEFIAYAKAHPGKINMGSGGIGTTLHVSGELFKMMTGVDMLHVPYRGVEALYDALRDFTPSTEALDIAETRRISVHGTVPGCTPMAGTIPGHRA